MSIFEYTTRCTLLIKETVFDWTKILHIKGILYLEIELIRIRCINTDVLGILTYFKLIQTPFEFVLLLKNIISYLKRFEPLNVD